MKLRIVVLPGDGIGPEVTKQAVAVLQTVSDVCGYEFRFETHRIGGAAIEQDGTPLPERTLAACLEADAVLLGAVGRAGSTHLTGEKRPEAGLLALATGTWRIRQPASRSRRTRRSRTVRLCART